LPDGDKYLWVRYEPITDNGEDYLIDWTHEREWRATVRERDYGIIRGVTPCEGVPLVFPPIPPDKEVYCPWIIVKTEREVVRLREWLARVPEYKGKNAFIRAFHNRCHSLKIVSIDLIAKHIEAGINSWGRFETLPEGVEVLEREFNLEFQGKPCEPSRLWSNAARKPDCS
jgi:hypothetical protein